MMIAFRFPLVLALALVLALGLAAPAPAAERFVPGMQDLPLMKELAAVDGSDIVFDKPEGRIVEAIARGKVKRDAVRAFYTATLPQLGWEPAASADSWVRESETLHLDFKGRDGDLWVTFSLVPR